MCRSCWNSRQYGIAGAEHSVTLQGRERLRASALFQHKRVPRSHQNSNAGQPLRIGLKPSVANRKLAFASRRHRALPHLDDCHVLSGRQCIQVDGDRAADRRQTRTADHCA